MTTLESQLEAYNEAKIECEKYVNFSGDKRSFSYKLLSRRVIDLWMNRMNHLAKKLNLPTYQQQFFDIK